MDLTHCSYPRRQDSEYRSDAAVIIAKYPWQIYGEGYHGYWTTDPTKLNPHFGGADDLKALSSALHSRGMFLMVDVAINNLVSQTKDITDESLATASDGTLLFKKREHYHPPCNIAWNNRTSEREW